MTDPRPDEVARLRVDPTFAWTAALLPLAYVPIAYLAPQAALVSAGVLAIAAAVSCVLDHHRIRAALHSEDLPSPAVLIPVLYLVFRTVKARSTPAIPVVGFATLGRGVLAQLTFAQIVQFDGGYIERDVQKWVRDQGYRGAVVDCPDKTIRDGATVTCTVTADGRTAMIDATLEDDYYTWKWGQ